MPVPQITPPGFLDQHSLLVALTPAAIVSVGAIAAAILDWNTPKASLGRTRWMAAINMMAAVVILALFLKPAGPAAAYTEPLAGGLVRIGWLPSGMALALACWSAWRWSPWPDRYGQSLSTWSWSARVALAMLLPVVSLPIIALVTIFDQEPRAELEDPAPRWWPIMILLVATCAAILLQLSDLTRNAISLSAGTGLIITGIIMTGPWRFAIIAAGAAQCVFW